MSDIEDSRDEGSRYFEEKKMKCFYCRKVGHLFRDCKKKEISCFLCNADHEPTRCPLSLICFHCYKRGHSKAECLEKSVRKYCSKCQNNSHATMECEKIWRKYKTVQSSSTRVKKYCYLCGKSGHFGDDCPTNNFRFRHSAFSQDVLDSFIDSSGFQSLEKSRSNNFKSPQKFKTEKHKHMVDRMDEDLGNSTKKNKKRKSGNYESDYHNKNHGSHSSHSSHGNSRSRGGFYERSIKSSSPRIKKRW